MNWRFFAQKKHFQIRAATFPLLALVLILVCVGLSSQHSLSLLRTIRQKVERTNQAYLPSILDNQQLLINIENLRRYVELIFISTDPEVRHTAKVNATALVNDSLFAPGTPVPGSASQLHHRIQILTQAKSRAEQIQTTLQTYVWQLLSTAHSLAVLLNRPIPLPSPKAFTRNGEESPLALQEFAQLTASCSAKSALAGALGDLCSQLFNAAENYQKTAHTLTKETSSAEASWKELEQIFLTMSNNVSVTESQKIFHTMESIHSQTQDIESDFYLALAVISIILLLLILTIHHFFVAPLMIAAKNLQQIRDGLPTAPMPPVHIRELQELVDMLPRLRAHIMTINQQSAQLKKEKNRYATLSLTDPLTGIANRRSFEFELERMPSASTMSALMLDIDHFKQFNDMWGHQAGDMILRNVAGSLQESITATAKLFRYGGEEFAILLPSENAQQALFTAKQIQTNLSRMQSDTPNTFHSTVTLSIGIASRELAHPVSTLELVARADKALYRAKNTGRNQICVYAPDYKPRLKKTPDPRTTPHTFS